MRTSTCGVRRYGPGSPHLLHLLGWWCRRAPRLAPGVGLALQCDAGTLASRPVGRSLKDATAHVESLCTQEIGPGKPKDVKTPTPAPANIRPARQGVGESTRTPFVVSAAACTRNPRPREREGTMIVPRMTALQADPTRRKLDSRRTSWPSRRHLSLAVGRQLRVDESTLDNAEK